MKNENMMNEDYLMNSYEHERLSRERLGESNNTFDLTNQIYRNRLIEKELESIEIVSSKLIREDKPKVKKLIFKK